MSWELFGCGIWDPDGALGPDPSGCGVGKQARDVGI